uniref:Uncharacterized protein n=1 Tax=Oryza barthii TaxID=65489 RepID=A0A0D3FYR7_9ORYZ
MPPQPPQPAVDDDVLGAPLPPAMKVFITDAVADPLAASHGGCRRNRTPFRLHRAPLPPPSSSPSPPSSTGCGRRLPPDLGEESEVGGGDGEGCSVV